ncbi:MAG: hypothetical protein H6837_08105 [Planctomycetes bacterium]|nr:hypothetical protein [Planctomycetota bacterium]
MSPRSTLSLFLVSLGSLLPAQVPEAKQQEQKRLLQQIDEAQAERQQIIDGLLHSIQVNDKTLSPQDLKRETVFLAGQNLIELKILEFIVQEWKDRLIKEEGKKPEDFKIDDGEIEKELKDQLREFAVKYPGIDFWTVVRSQTGIAKNRYVHQRRVTMLFDKVFMPGPPDQWPQITAEAVKAGANNSDGDKFWDGLKKNGRDKDGKPREMPKFWAEMIRKMLIGQLKKWTDIKFPADGLPPGVALDVNGRQWSTTEAFEQIKEGLFIQDMETAISEIVLREALTQELTKSGAYLGAEAFSKAFAEYRKEFDNTIFNTEMIARAFKGYPTLEAFRSRWRLMKSYENMIAKEINNDNLQAHANKHKRFFADGSVNVDVIQFLGKDVRSGAWVPNGMDEAHKRAVACMQKIESKEKTFDQALDAFGEFYTNDKERGRIGNKSFNELRRSLRESEYSDLLQGFSLGYFLFYDAEVGKAVGPVKGPDAWYIVRVNSRAPAKQAANVSDPRTRELVKQDYLTHRFLEWSKEVMSRTKLQ